MPTAAAITDALHADIDAAVGPSPDPMVINLSAPGRLHNHPTSSDTYWLGWRLVASPWPGYFRIGFASDLDFNSATLDIHHSEFETVRRGIERLAEGRSAGLHFNTPAELMTPRYRRAVGAVLLCPSPPIATVEILGLDYDPVATVSAFAPDIVKGALAIAPLLGTVEEGPARRGLRRLEVAEETMLPNEWTQPEHAAREQLVSEIRERHGDQHAELCITFPDVAGQYMGRDVRVSTLEYDFGDWPVVAALAYRTSDEEDRTALISIAWPDVQALRQSTHEPMVSLRAGGTVRVDIPEQDRARVAQLVAEKFGVTESVHSDFSARLLQIPLFSEQPAENMRNPKSVTPRTAAPQLRQEEQLDLFRPGSAEEQPTPSPTGSTDEPRVQFG